MRQRNDGTPTDVPMTDARKEELSHRPFANMSTSVMPLIRANKCSTCKKDILAAEFRDLLSKKEYNISGMCQACQDSVFGGKDE